MGLLNKLGKKVAKSDKPTVKKGSGDPKKVAKAAKDAGIKKRTAPEPQMVKKVKSGTPPLARKTREYNPGPTSRYKDAGKKQDPKTKDLPTEPHKKPAYKDAWPKHPGK